MESKAVFFFVAHVLNMWRIFESLSGRYLRSTKNLWKKFPTIFPTVFVVFLPSKLLEFKYSHFS